MLSKTASSSSKYILTTSFFFITGYTLYSLSSKHNDDYVCFRPESTNDRINDMLNTGDIIIFQRGMPKEFSMRSLFNFLSRTANHNSWDHMGVIVRDRDPKNDVPYVLEATYDGVKLRPFDERVLKSKSQIISIRQLFPKPNINYDIVGMQIAQEAVYPKNSKLFQLSFKDLIYSIFFPPQSRTTLRSVLKLESINNELKYLNNSTIKNEKIIEKRNLEKQELLNRIQANENSYFTNLGLKSRFADAELVAWYYQQLGFLPTTPKPEDYCVRDFVKEGKTKTLPLKDFKLGEEVVIRM